MRAAEFITEASKGRTLNVLQPFEILINSGGRENVGHYGAGAVSTPKYAPTQTKVGDTLICERGFLSLNGTGARFSQPKHVFVTPIRGMEAKEIQDTLRELIQDKCLKGIGVPTGSRQNEFFLVVNSSNLAVRADNEEIANKAAETFNANEPGTNWRVVGSMSVTPAAYKNKIKRFHYAIRQQDIDYAIKYEKIADPLSDYTWLKGKIEYAEFDLEHPLKPAKQ